MADKMSAAARKAYKAAYKKAAKKRKSHWLFIQKGDSGKEIVSKLFTQFACLVLIACIGILVNEARLSISAQFINSSMQDLYYKYIDNIADNFGGSSSGGPTESAKAMLEVNPDTVGWLKIDDTHIDLPVVQRRGSGGNEYYLKIAFDGSTNKAGTVFLDARDTLTEKNRSSNLIFYGHNQKDKTMFGDLEKYKNNVDFYKDHPYVTFSSNYRTDKYKIFAYFVTPVLPTQTRDGIIFDYHNFIDLDRSKYNEFISNIELRNEIITPVDVQYGDEFITLSTCSNEFDPSRFVVFARKIRDGEEEFIDTAAATLNPGALKPDFNFIYGRA
ncbi:MAG: class B sortase [Ruminococcus sp.]|jgi:sortase B|nr:class B sortase [Ruminococcus sp.]